MEETFETDLKRKGRVDRLGVKVYAVNDAKEDNREVEVISEVANEIALNEGESNAGGVVVSVLVHDEGHEGGGCEEGKEEDKDNIEGGNESPDPSKIPSSLPKGREGDIGVEEEKIVRELDGNVEESSGEKVGEDGRVPHITGIRSV